MRNARDGLPLDGNQWKTRGQDSEVAATRSIARMSPAQSPGGEQEPRRESVRHAGVRETWIPLQLPERGRFVRSPRQQEPERALAQGQASPAPRPLAQMVSGEPIRRMEEQPDAPLRRRRASPDSASRTPARVSRLSPSPQVAVRPKVATTRPGRIARGRGRSPAWRWPPPVRTITRYESVS